LKKYLDSIVEKIKKRYRKFRQKLLSNAIFRKWRNAGHPYPPPHEYKQGVVKTYAARYSLDTLIETGTQLGALPWAVQDDFKKIYTIELNIDRYLNAKEKFYLLPQIEVIKGESGEQLSLLLKSIDYPALFWLDTHESLEKGLTELSIKKEISAILNTQQNHVLLIPDARLFTSENEYPSLIEIRNYISALRPSYHFEVEHDIIRAYESGIRSKE